MKKDEPPLEFPDTLEGFEYAFNESKFSLERKKEITVDMFTTMFHSL